MDAAGLEDLYVRLEKPVYNVVYRCVWDREEARDLTQDAFARLWEMRRRVVPETVEPLLYRIALNLARSRLRRRRLARLLGPKVLLDALRDPPAVPGADLAAAERSAALRDALLALPRDLREVVLLTTFSELGYDRIGTALGIPSGTVGSRRNRALKLLRQRLGSEVGHERA